ncbi:MAG: metallophosphoesterase [Solirubrobacteraceae bacterium]
MRTLVVSDLHLGARSQCDLLRMARPREALLNALPGFDRLVLLGDVIELRQGPVTDILAVAEEVLGEIGSALGPGREAIVVPGNHDHQLAAAWLARRARNGACAPAGLERAADSAPLGLESDVDSAPLGLESAVDCYAGELLGAVVGWLAPARVRVAYPGVWLRDDLYAIHGHYGDRHTTVPMLERLGAGAMARIVREAASGPRCAEDYEAALGPLYAWIDSIAQSAVGEVGRASQGVSVTAWRALTGTGRSASLRRRGLVAMFPVLVAGLNRAGLGPLRADLSREELRRASLRAFDEVLARLHVTPAHVIFGHTHRAGPLVGETRREWTTRSGTQLLNIGSWIHETGLIGDAPRQSPYRPGFCAVVGDEGPPELRNLLDEVQAPTRRSEPGRV